MHSEITGKADMRAKVIVFGKGGTWKMSFVCHVNDAREEVHKAIEREKADYAIVHHLDGTLSYRLPELGAKTKPDVTSIRFVSE